MRSKISKILMLMAFFLGFTFLTNAQSTNVTLVVTKTNGEELTYQLNAESQLYFENGDRIFIEDGTGTSVSFQLAEIRKLVCTDYANIGENIVSELQLTPNPVQNSFIINNLQNNLPARIYALDGRLVKSFTATEGQMIDISDLASGMYLLHIDGQTLKMMKL